MRVNDFLRAVIQESRKLLPPQLQNFDGRSRFTLIQIYFNKRSIHYEVWIRGGVKLIEIGLHCESDSETNSRLLQFFRTRELEIRGELGTQVECERWTKSWTRVHQVIQYRSLDDALVSRVARELANMISVLQPMLDQYETNPAGELKRTLKRRSS